MRIETASAWILASLCVLTIWTALLIFEVPEASKFAGLLIAMGLVYFGIGAVLTVMHDRHMAKRIRSRQTTWRKATQRGITVSDLAALFVCTVCLAIGFMALVAVLLP